MKKLILLALVAAILTGFSCEKNDPIQQVAPVNVNFKATFNGQPFLAYKKYDYLAGKQVFFNLFQFFISDAELVRADGSTAKLSDINYVNLTFDKDADADAGKTLNFAGIPEGEYTGIRLGIGVSADLNNINPNQLADSHPLAVNSRAEFWSGWKSYIFMKIEGKYDADGDGANFENPLLYHCGSDAVYRTLTFTKPITVSVGGANSVGLTLDIAKILRENGQPLDLVGSPATSDDPSDVIVATKLMNNLSTAVQIQ